MLDQTTAEQMLYSTVKLTASKHGAPFSTGTGFFISFACESTKGVPTIVTNKHVIGTSDQVTVVCHLAEDGRPSGKFIECKMRTGPGSVFNHPDPSIDLCAIPIGNILEQARAANTPIFFRQLSLDFIPDEDDWRYFDAIEEVVMLGCPNGISDEANNLPIARRGITATSLGKNYNGKPEFMVDMACFPGSSGSPIFILNQNGFLDRKNNVYKIGESRFHLVGVLYAGPQITNSGQLILTKPPEIFVNAMMHLGNAIRATQLRTIDLEVRRMLSSMPKPEVSVGAIIE